MSDVAVKFVNEGNARCYYHTREWINKQADVMSMYHRECVCCKAEGVVKTAAIVHHVNRLKAQPEYAVTDYVAANIKDKELALKCCDTAFRQYICGEFKVLIRLDTDKFFIKGENKIIQLLPVCREHHKMIHGSGRYRVAKPGSLDEKFPELL